MGPFSGPLGRDGALLQAQGPLAASLAGPTPQRVPNRAPQRHGAVTLLRPPLPCAAEYVGVLQTFDPLVCPIGLRALMFFMLLTGDNGVRSPRAFFVAACVGHLREYCISASFLGRPCFREYLLTLGTDGKAHRPPAAGAIPGCADGEQGELV